MRTALLVIATGEKYHRYLHPLLVSARRFFPTHDSLVWSDWDGAVGDRVFRKEGLGYPGETLHRYHTFLTQSALLESYDQLFYCDVDMLFVAPVGEEIFSTGITATLHPGYVGGRGTPETNPKSYAFCDTNRAYYCGGFNGGNAHSFLSMAEELSKDIDADSRRGVTAVWHDESHLNRYLTTSYSPAKILGPEYCYPEDAGDYYKNKWRAAGLGEVEPKLLALTKAGR